MNPNPLFAACLALLSTLLNIQVYAQGPTTGLLVNTTASKSYFDHPTTLSTVALDARAPPPPVNPFQWWKYYTFVQFGNVPNGQGPAYKNMILNAVTLVNDILATNMGIVSAQAQKPADQPIDDASFLRYFGQDKEAATNVDKVLVGMTQGMGHPSWEPLRNCIPPPPMIFVYYDNPPVNVYYKAGVKLCAEDSDVRAYVFGPDDEFPNTYWSIAFCPKWFTKYKPFIGVSRTANLLPPYIELGFADISNEPSYFSEKTVLHELMHFGPLYRHYFSTPLDGGNIQDCQFVDPDQAPWPDGNPKIIPAYGAFYSWFLANKEYKPHYRGQEAPGKSAPLYNAENYVNMMLENYLRVKSIPWVVWQDPPDRRTGPHFPPDHPLRALAPQQPNNDQTPMVNPDDIGPAPPT